MEKVKDKATRLWYMEQTLANGWSQNVLLVMVESDGQRRLRKGTLDRRRIERDNRLVHQVVQGVRVRSTAIPIEHRAEFRLVDRL
jgi:hypothetical protein